ncbi:MAG: phenylalanine--tRNA ligase subunit beta [Candidatus Neomarinimicrobiota bacterium]|nr:MAG: phenylalanine--tRNA ligase subunit beta [Candidatus Neomarinimicrobiota bacterium]
MIVNTKWLERYTDIPYSPRELEEKLTYLGLESTVKKNPVERIEGVIISEIKEVLPHPNADRLQICRVDTGSGTMDVVCGAPNVAPGQKVPLARTGTVLPNGMELKPVKIRGVKSEGMICAEDELGLSDDHSGIMVLSDDAPLGIELKEYLGNGGASIDIDLTPNRPDCTSHIGVARDITLLTGNELKIPEINLKESAEPVADFISVEIENKIGCPRYAARVVKGVNIGPSPKWLTDYLTSVGLRSINNVVDVANFVLLETGHPLHTFDYHMIEGKKIIVRSAADGEEVVTLDGVRRELNEDVLLICDGKKPVAVAGIMGLENSEIKDDTKDILIESAYFDPATIRKGSRYLGLQTDASYRFERGADPEGVIYALNRLADLIVEVAGGSVCRGIVDNYVRKIDSAEIKVRYQRVNALLGMSIEPAWMLDKFQRLGCRIIEKNDEYVVLKVPTWRPDLEREVDMIEEVVRIYGMHVVPNARELRIQPNYYENREYQMVEELRQTIANMGLYEVCNNSLVSQNHVEFGLQNLKPVKIANPLGQDMSFMRTTLIPGLLQNARHNINRQKTDLQLFEMGFVQEYDPRQETHAREYQKYAILLTGYLEDKYWKYEQRTSDIFILKGMLQTVLNHFGIRDVEFVPGKHHHFRYLIEVRKGTALLVYFGQVEPTYLAKVWDIDAPVFVLEGDVNVLFKIADQRKIFKPLPVFPVIRRDVSILVAEDKKIADIEHLIWQKGGEFLKECRFYDLYTGKNIDKGLKSITFNLVFQAEDRTLQDNEIDKIMSAIHRTLKDKAGAQLR